MVVLKGDVFCKSKQIFVSHQMNTSTEFISFQLARMLLALLFQEFDFSEPEKR